MKKLLILICILFLVGCNKTEQFDINAVAYLSYNDIKLVEEQLLDVKALINNINFSKKNIKDNFKKYIYLITDEKVLEFFVSEKHNMLIVENGNRYYSNDVKEIEALMTYLQNIQEIYTNANFYQVEMIDTYINDDQDMFIDINKSNIYIVIKSQINIFNFIINATENIDDEVNVIDQLYKKEYIEKNKKIVIRIDKPEMIANYHITFDTPYGYNVIITPYYDSNSNTIKFNKIFKRKEAMQASFNYLLSFKLLSAFNTSIGILSSLGFLPSINLYSFNKSLLLALTSKFNSLDSSFLDLSFM